MEFPRLVYKSAESYSVANDDDEHAALIAAGWFASVPEALAPRVAPIPAPLPDLSPDQQDAAADSAPTRAELEQKAAELGVEFSARIGDGKLADRINEAIAAKA